MQRTPHISTAVSSRPKVYGGPGCRFPEHWNQTPIFQRPWAQDRKYMGGKKWWKVTNGFERVSRFFVIFHDFRPEGIHFWRVQNIAYASKKKSCWHGQRFWRSKSPCLESKIHTLSLFFATPRKKLSIFRVVSGLTGKGIQGARLQPHFPRACLQDDVSSTRRTPSNYIYHI